MDPVTHVLVGAAVAKTYRLPRFHFWVLMVLAELPDLDIFFRQFGLNGPLSTHRSWTHSFLFVGVMGAAVWWITRVFRRDESAPWMAYLLAAGSHVLCDWMTSYGTPLLWPFSSANFSLDWVSNLSLGPLIILGGGLLAVKICRDREWIVPSMWGVLGLFLAVSVVLHAQALAYAKPGDTAYALPDLVNPLDWRVIDEDRSAREYQLYSVRPLLRKASFLGVYPLPPDSPWIAQSQSDVRVRRFLRNDRWPVAWVTPQDKGATVEWGNLLFFWSGRLRGKLAVEMDANGRVVSVRHV